MNYKPQEIESKWQNLWEKKKIYQAVDDSEKQKFYVLIEFPYPSGAGLHVGHARSWSAMDAYSRKKRMQGYNVLFPIGWDAFGLPTENYAIKHKIHPSLATADNVATFKRQIKSLGLSFDWSREINTTDPKYYKWTQWIFLKLLEKGLAYQDEVPVNWCPFCKTNLADEEVLTDNNHERCGQQTEKRLQKQWLLKITDYAQRLLDDLNLVDYSQKIRIQQENWIGRSEGITIDYPLAGGDKMISCYSTRPDTNFGATFVVMAPEHPLVFELTTAENKSAVEEYLKQTKIKSEIERENLEKEKTGVFTGSYVLNRLTNKKMPVWVADFAILSAGTGIVVGVPAHDKRDWQFAEKYNLDIAPVVKPINEDCDFSKGPFVDIDEAVIFNSSFLDGLPALKAKDKIINYLVEKRWGKKAVNYHLRDWVFSRQHYWGEPIPVVHCQKCGIVPVPEKDLPIELPYVEKYEPSGTGESPLANIKDWVNTECPHCGSPAKRETDTMPNWAGSNWYYLAYLIADKLGVKSAKRKAPCLPAGRQNEKDIFEERGEQIRYWMPVDIYQGGFEHTTLHLLYSRFIYKFLYDIGAVPNLEPYLKRRSHGVVLGPDNRKMSKSFGNVVNPDEIISKYGADTLRLYEMFIGPFDQAVSWNEDSLQGCFRFLTRTWRLLNENIKRAKTPENLSRKLHQTIKKVDQDLELLKFNTAVAALMEFINDWEKSFLSKEDAELLVKTLAPLAPHLAEEAWTEVLKNEFSVHQQSWPKFDEKLIIENKAIIVVQINGKVRAQIETDSQASQDQAEVASQAKKHPQIIKYLEGKEIKKIIFIPGKLINFVF